MKRVLWLGLASSRTRPRFPGRVLVPDTPSTNGPSPDATAPSTPGRATTAASPSRREQGRGPRTRRCDANVRDANGAGVLDAICSFNWDCQTTLRCECDETTGCACKPGARGTGRNGIDPVHQQQRVRERGVRRGPARLGIVCSDECGTSADCVDKLPLCQTISFVGRICIRTRRSSSATEADDSASGGGNARAGGPVGPARAAAGVTRTDAVAGAGGVADAVACALATTGGGLRRWLGRTRPTPQAPRWSA